MGRSVSGHILLMTSPKSSFLELKMFSGLLDRCFFIWVRWGANSPHFLQSIQNACQMPSWRRGVWIIYPPFPLKLCWALAGGGVTSLAFWSVLYGDFNTRESLGGEIENTCIVCMYFGTKSQCKVSLSLGVTAHCTYVAKIKSVLMCVMLGFYLRLKKTKFVHMQ